MAKYKAQAYLTKDGAIVKPGEDVELTAQQADKLGGKVSKTQSKRKAKEEPKEEPKQEEPQESNE